MKNKFLSKCKISILAMLGSFLVAICLFTSATLQVATGTELDKADIMAESDEVIMYYDKNTAMISLKYKDTGSIINTKVMDGKSGNKVYKNYQKSDFIIDYYDNTKSSSTTTVNNYDMAIEKGQVEVNKIKNGVKLVYTLKADKLSMDVVPKYISQEKMETMILDKISAEDRKWLSDFYRLYEGYYIRTKDSGVTQSAIKRLQTMFYEVCGYTEEDLHADNAEKDYVSEWSNIEIHISIEYILDGGDLLVKVPVDEYYCNKDDSILNAISVLPYFMSATLEDEGYMVVPDGSGAVINFNNGMTKSVDYVSRIFGKDILLDAGKYDSTEYYANMPMFGMVYSDYAYLTIVEEGATMAEINTQISKKNDDYNKAYYKFYIQEMENVATVDNAEVHINKYTGDAFHEDIVIRYRMLDAEDANYSGIAKAYQEYLIDSGVLKKDDRAENASLFLEILGATKESKNFLGIPYQGISSLTTFKDAQEMLQYFVSAGVENMDVQLTGWANHGENNSALTKLRIASSMGSKKELNALASYAKENGYSFYPALNFQTVYAADNFFSNTSTNRFVSKYASKFLSLEYAQLGTTRLGLDNLRINSLSGYLISPRMLNKYMEQALSKIDKLSLNGIAVMDIGNQLVADYAKKQPVSREHAADIENEALGKVSENYEILAKSPYSYAWEYIDKMSDLPTRSNEYNVFSYDIPLLQLVLDGCVSYSMTPLNYDTQKDNKEMLLKCIETRINPKFIVMQAEMGDLKYTEEYYDLLSVNFDDWKERITAVYDEYNTFYQMVKDADIEKHETPYKNIIRVTYSNGIKVYVNYSKKAFMVDGNILDASSYLIENN